MAMVAYNPKRQIIEVDSIPLSEYEEKVLICIPSFAWAVARAFLRTQAKWGSTYSISYHISYYVTPDIELMDTIEASIDEALGSDDLSCNIVEALDRISAQVTVLSAKSCGPGCGGSGGAGAAEGPPYDWVDDGENTPPNFEERDDYLAWKCAMSNFLIDRLILDLEKLKGIAVTEITAMLLSSTLLTPIPLDDIALLVGVLAAWAVEEVLDTIIDEVLVAVDVDRDYLVCLLYNSISAQVAEDGTDGWAWDVLGSLAYYLFDFFTKVDSFNQLFEGANLVVSEEECDCEEVIETCFDFETGGSLYGWAIESGVGTYSLDLSEGGLTAKQEGSGFSEIRVNSPSGQGRIVNSGDIWTIDHAYIATGGQGTLNVWVVFDDESEAFIFNSGGLSTFSRTIDTLDLSSHTGKVIEYFKIRSADSQAGSRTYILYVSCIASGSEFRSEKIGGKVDRGERIVPSQLPLLDDVSGLLAS